MRLAVELYGIVIGTLEGDHRTYDFVPTTDALDGFGTNSAVLSVAIPLSPRLPRGHAARRRNWFSELLPEGDTYEYMLRDAQLRRGDTLAFLARYGRDVAGALQIWDLDDPTEPRTPELRRLTQDEIRSLLEDPLGSPLANAPGTGKSSLPGVQTKIVLTRLDGGWAQALGGYPTTHILKPELPGGFATMIYDEEYGARLARGLGLADYATWIEDFAGKSALVIERYDRVAGERVHQEDFSQALGASRDEKYQEYGGVVSMGRVASVLREFAPDDLPRLLRMLVLAVGVGNLDMHAKNLGLVHAFDGSVRLAPSYDVVPQLHFDNDRRLAMAVNGKYRHADVSRADLQAEAASWGLRRSADIVDDTLKNLRSLLVTETPLDGSFSGLQEHLIGIVDRLLVGTPGRG